MRVRADVSAFHAVVSETRARLTKLNRDGSLDGLVSLFDRLMDDLPADFLVCEFVPPISTNGLEELPPFIVRVRPGPRLHAIACTLWALDLSADVHAGPPAFG